MEMTIKAAEAAHHPHRLVLLFAEKTLVFKPAPAPVAKSARAQAGLRKFAARPGETLLLPQGDQLWLFAGLGARKSLSRSTFCEAVGKGLAELRKAGAAKISLILPDGLPWPPGEAARYAGEALLMAGYAFKVYRTKEKGPPPCQVELLHPGGAAPLRAGLDHAQAVGAGILLARDLINHPAAVAHTDFLLEQARGAARGVKATFKEIRGDDLLEQGYGAIHAVGRSGSHPPSLAILEFGRPSPKKPTVALVGKGVVFDSGGYDLKPSSGMALMKKDMGGAAIALGAFQAIAGLGLPLHLVCVLGLAENMVGPDAYRPGDVLRTKAGLTVEITNTDAEGRLVLADAMALAREYKPDFMVDFATLTGACRVALGKELMGLFCDDKPMREALMASADATGEHAWPLPLWKPYRAKLDSPIADLVNAPADGMGGAITAALFLREFTGNTRWAHFDCYGWSEGESPLFPKGGSGAGVRLMVDWATRLSQGGKK